VSRAKASLDHRRIRRLIWLVLTVFLLLGYSLQSVAGTTYYSNEMQNYATVSTPPVILQNGTAGTSTIYTNNTSAKVKMRFRIMRLSVRRLLFFKTARRARAQSTQTVQAQRLVLQPRFGLMVGTNVSKLRLIKTMLIVLCLTFLF